MIILLVASILCAGCAPSPQQFNSQAWKSGGASVRGSMVLDLQARRLLKGKSKVEVEEMLGKPDYSASHWQGFKVVTIPRCNFWVCRMEVYFDEETEKVEDVAVSD